MFYPLRCQFSRTISRSRTRLRVIFFHSGVVTRSESQSQGSWIGNRVLPEDLTNTLVPEKRLPWGFISQEIVENEVIPKAKHSGILSFLDSIKWIGVGPLDGLMYFNLDVDEVTEGVKQAYRVTTDIYSEGKPVFESQYGDIIDPKLGRCFDSHIKQYDGEPNIATKVNVEEIVDVEVYLCFPFFRSDHGKYLLSKLGENELTNNIVTLQKCLTTMWNELDSESPGTLTLVITACVTVREAGFSAEGIESVAKTNKHVLTFTCTDDFKYFFSKPTFVLSNLNEALAYFQDDPRARMKDEF